MVENGEPLPPRGHEGLPTLFAMLHISMITISSVGFTVNYEVLADIRPGF